MPLLKPRRGGGGWGRSPRPTAEDLPDWAHDFQGPGWAATPHPEAAASKRKVKAALILAGMLAALPVSVVACVIAVTSSGSGSGSAAPEPVVTAPSVEEWSSARTEAEIAAQRWLRLGGLEPSGWAWRESRTSLLPCFYSFPCEDHLFKLSFESGGGAVLAVTIDPVTGAVAGVSMLDEEALREDEALGEDGQDGGAPEEGARPVWTNSRDRGADLPDGHIEKITAWASAWARRDLHTLAELAGEDTYVASAESESPYDVFVLASRWWVLHPSDSVEVLSLVGGPPSEDDLYLVTVAFSLAQQCSDVGTDAAAGPPAPLCSECSTSAASGQSFCDGRLDMTADLWIEAGRQHMYVLESARVGGLNPEVSPHADETTQEGA